jgi:Ca2+/Na+ antiporter
LAAKIYAAVVNIFQEAPMQRIVIKRNMAVYVLITLAIFTVAFYGLTGRQTPWELWFAVVFAPLLIIFWMLSNRYVALDGAVRKATLPFMLFFRRQAPWDEIAKRVEEEQIEDHGHAKTVYKITASGPFEEASAYLDSEEDFEGWAEIEGVEAVRLGDLAQEKAA